MTDRNVMTDMSKALVEQPAPVAKPHKQEPTSGDYALGYAEGFNDACKPAQQEPIAWLDEEKRNIYWHNTHDVDDYHGFKRTTPLYKSPPAQRPWVGLTEQEAAECLSTSTVRTWQAIEAKLRSKNENSN